MIDKELLAILACPETHQSLAEADAGLVEHVNRRIAERALRNAGGALVEEPIDGGLVREDGHVLYPIREEIPVLLVEEGIVLDEPERA